MATRGTNTQAEALQKMLGDISYIKTLPDANLEFLVNLETVILKEVRGPIDQVQAAQQAQQGGGGMGGMTGMPPGANMPMPVSMAPPAGGARGMRTEPGMPNPDELRRMLG